MIFIKLKCSLVKVLDIHFWRFSLMLDKDRLVQFLLESGSLRIENAMLCAPYAFSIRERPTMPLLKQLAGIYADGIMRAFPNGKCDVLCIDDTFSFAETLITAIGLELYDRDPEAYIHLKVCSFGVNDSDELDLSGHRVVVVNAEIAFQEEYSRGRIQQRLERSGATIVGMIYMFDHLESGYSCDRGRSSSIDARGVLVFAIICVNDLVRYLKKLLAQSAEDAAEIDRSLQTIENHRKKNLFCM